MNRSLFAAALVVVGTLFLGGCGKSPAAVCEKLEELKAKEAKEKKSDEDKKKSIEKCTKDAEEQKNKDPKTYECAADCMNKASALKEFGECAEKCEKDKGK